MDTRLKFLERIIRSSIRNSFVRLPWSNFSISAVARHLAREVITTSRESEQGQIFAPDQFTLSIHPRDAGEITPEHSDIQREVALDLQRALVKADFHLVREPHLTLATDPTLSKGEVRVITWHSSDPIDLEDLAEQVPVATTDHVAIGAFLVVGGKKHFPLRKSIVNIGRLIENDLVLDDRHISRRHAQVRAQQGRFKLIDLQSTVGTIVNGKRIKEHVLRPGDVITLARIELIYGEDRGGPPDATPPYLPSLQPIEDRDRVTPLDLKIIRDEDL